MFHDYDHGIMNYQLCMYFFFNYLWLFSDYKNKIYRFEKCHKIKGVQSVFHALKQKKGIWHLPEYPTRTNPKMFGLGWFGFGEKMTENRPDPTRACFIGLGIFTLWTRPDPCTPLEKRDKRKEERGKRKKNLKKKREDKKIESIGEKKKIILYKFNKKYHIFHIFSQKYHIKNDFPSK